MPSELRALDCTLRFASGRCASNYPLAVHGEVTWHAAPVENHWYTRVELENLKPGELLLPSVVLLTNSHYAVRCSLTADANEWWLAAISTDTRMAKFSAPAANSQQDDSVTTHLDVYAVHQHLPKVTLSIELVCNTPPKDYLLVVSRRQQTHPRLDFDAVHNAPRAEIKARSISQMVQPASQRDRTCSPTSLSMLMSYHDTPYHPAFIDQCKEPTTGLYGVWPLNVMQASRRGFVAAAELVSTWDELKTVQQPFVASLRFDSNQLTGAPLEHTAGHLVLVRGTSATRVFCSDPAAPDAESVERDYDLVQFSNAWLGFRGATYIVAPAHAETHSEKSEGQLNR